MVVSIIIQLCPITQFCDVANFVFQEKEKQILSHKFKKRISQEMLSVTLPAQLWRNYGRALNR